jgi:hypothetical protein
MPPSALTVQNHQQFLDALGEHVLSHSAIGQKPLEIDCKPPLPTKIRAYIYKTTAPTGGPHPTGGRPVGEFKSQIIVPGQDRGEKGNFDHSGGRIVYLVGFVPDLDVWVLWDANRYENFAWSRNVQVKAEGVHEAYFGQISSQIRKLRGALPGDETVICAPSRLLPQALVQRFSMYSTDLWDLSTDEVKQCPQCAVKATGKDQIETLFGYRNMAGESPYDDIRPQSYCRTCRSTAKQGAEV